MGTYTGRLRDPVAGHLRDQMMRSSWDVRESCFLNPIVLEDIIKV